MGLSRGKCAEPNESGKACNSNSDCANGKCGRLKLGKKNKKVCCPENRDLLGWFGYDYCVPFAKGEDCNGHAQCASKNCSGSLLKTGKCQ